MYILFFASLTVKFIKIILLIYFMQVLNCIIYLKMNILTSHAGLILLLICGYANSQCASGTVLIDTICVPCPQYCQTCNANGTCTTCSTGTLISGKCLVCSLNCQTRTACSSVPTDCTSCATHLSLGSTSPKKCVTPAACPI